MSGRDPERHERARHLMMAALDGELSAPERTELDRLLAEDADLREEMRTMGRVKEVTGAMSYRKPPEEVWGTYWVSVFNRAERGVGWILVTLGTLVVVGYGAWNAVGALLADTGLPGFVKVAVFAAALGGLILLVSVAREKWLVGRRDPYKEIER